jgi:hypothetical protein
MFTFTPNLAAFRFYADGTEAGSVALAAQNTNITVNATSDVIVLLRFRVQETGGAAAGSSLFYTPQISKNGGAYAGISSSNIVYYNSANLTGGGATTNRLTGGTGSFEAGDVEEADNQAAHQLGASNFTEFLYVFRIVAADVADGDTFDFRLVQSGATFTYSVTPRITVSIPVAAFDQTAFRFYADGTEAGSTALAAQNTNITQSIAFGIIGLRVRVQETAGADGLSSDDYNLYYSRNGGGYLQVTTGSSFVKLAAGPWNSGDATTNRLGAGSGSFVAGQAIDNANALGTVVNLQITASNYTELLWALQPAAGLAVDDTLDFRILRNSAVINAYSITPRITIEAGPTVGVAVETDTALSRGLAHGTGRADSTNTALARTAVVVRATGMASTTNTAISRGLAHGLGRANETDLAFALSPGTVQIQVGRADSTNTAIARTATLIRATGLVTEIDLAVQRGLVHGVNRALETDLALRLAIAHSVNRSSETDTAVARTHTLIRATGRADETDAAFELSAGAGVAVGVATETDTALRLATALGVNRASETDTAFAPATGHGTGRALESDLALSLGLSLTAARGDETDLAFRLGIGHVAGMAAETDASIALIAALLKETGISLENDSAFALLTGLSASDANTKPVNLAWVDKRIQPVFTKKNVEA